MTLPAYGLFAIIGQDLRFFPAWCTFFASEKKTTIVSQPCVDRKAAEFGHLDDTKIMLRDSLNWKLKTNIFMLS